MNSSHSKSPNVAAESRGAWPWAALALAWSAVVFVRYFSDLGKALPYIGMVFDAGAYPEASDSQWVAVWSESLKALGAVFLTAGATWSWGRRTRRWIGLAPSDNWIRFGIDFGLGVILLDLFWIGTGLCGLWYRPLWLAIGLLLALWFVIDAAQVLIGEFQKSFPKFSNIGSSYSFLCVMGLFYWLFSLLQNLAPETFYDSMVYHLAVPSYWVLHHGLSDFPTNFFSNFPFGAETYFLNGLVLQGTEAAKLLHAFSFGVCALFAGGWARELAGEKAGWLALGLTLSLPLFAMNTWTTQVEGFLALTVLLSLYALDHFLRQDKDRLAWALSAGLFAGLALSAKYTAILAIGSAFIVLAFQKPGFFAKDRLKSWMIFLLGGGLVLTPWLMKNLVYTGNPFFPYLMSLFQGRHLPDAGYARLLAEQHSRVTTEWWTWLKLPWTLVMAVPNSYNFAGPVALALVSLLFLFRLKHPVLRFLAGVIPLFFIVSLWATHILRFMVPDFVLFYILLAAVLAGGDRPGWAKGAAWFAGFSAVFCFAYLADITHFYYDCAGIWSGRQTRAQYLSNPKKITPYYAMAQWISANVPQDKRLLIAGDARGLYYERPFLTNTVFDEQALAKITKEAKDPEGIAKRLREMGVDYLVVNGLEGIRVSKDYHHYDLTGEEWKRLDGFIQRGTRMVYSQGLQAVYGLLPGIGEAPKEETVDVVTFFSEPASLFVLNAQSQNWQVAADHLKQTLELYPFSSFWKKQKADFEKNTRLKL